MVRAIAIVGPDEKLRWVEPSSGLTRDGRHADLFPSSELVRDDDAFDAALVTIGALGVIVAYVVEVRDAYGIWETVETLDWPTVRPMIAHGGPMFARPATWAGAPLDPAASYRAVEVLINPFPDPGTKERRVHVVRRAERTALTPGLEDWKRAGFFEQVKNALLGVWTLIQTVSEDVDDYGPALDRLLASGREDTGGFAPAHRVLNFGNERIERVWSVDVVLPTTGNVHLDFLDEVIARFDDLMQANLKFAGFLALRFSRASRASLAMQSPPGADPHLRFAELELFLLQSPFDPVNLDLWREWELVQDGERFYEVFCEIAEKHRRRGTLRVHWGQMMPSLASFAPDAASLARWRRGRDRLVVGRPYLFANAMMLATGVVEPPAGFLLDGVLPKSDGDALERHHHLALVAAAPIAGPDGALYAVDAHGSVSRRAGAQRWKALRPGEPVDEDRCPAGRLLAGRRKLGGPCLVARDARGRLRSSREERPGRWSEWERVDGDRVGEPTMVSTPNGLGALRPVGARARALPRGGGRRLGAALAHPGELGSRRGRRRRGGGGRHAGGRTPERRPARHAPRRRRRVDRARGLLAARAGPALARRERDRRVARAGRARGRARARRGRRAPPAPSSRPRRRRASRASAASTSRAAPPAACAWPSQTRSAACECSSSTRPWASPRRPAPSTWPRSARRSWWAARSS
ncbi:MAG: hypothetical protein M5U28_16205 [Sandaracinaceae bacterium]|nr:hypothetical protein [Sandaracinaceae bacterium]